MYECERATIDDLLSACAWIDSAEQCQLWVGERLDYPIDHERVAVALEFDRAASWKLSDASRIVAFGQLVPKPRSRFHLARLIVDPAHRGRGIGRVLVDELLDRVRASDARVASLNVDASNEPAVSLYLDAGFRRTERPDDEPDSSSLYLERQP